MMEKVSVYSQTWILPKINLILKENYGERKKEGEMEGRKKERQEYKGRKGGTGWRRQRGSKGETLVAAWSLLAWKHDIPPEQRFWFNCNTAVYQSNGIPPGRGHKALPKRHKLRGSLEQSWGVVPGNAETYPVLEVEVVELSPSASEPGEAAVAFISIA